MENIRTIISENLVLLRKQRGFTQSTLAERLNYSDKAISRWETGESLPDYETLERICELYGVEFNYLFTRHNSYELNEKIIRRMEKKNAIVILSITSIWTFLAVSFLLYAVIKNQYWWQLFIFGIPLTTAVLITYNHRVLKNPKLFVVGYSVLIWSTLASFFFQLISRSSVIWTIFIIGIPLQACITLIYYMLYYEK